MRKWSYNNVLVGHGVFVALVAQRLRADSIEARRIKTDLMHTSL